MDDETNKLLRQILDSQKEQTELMRKHLLPLWTRVRFSLLGLLLLMTFVAIGLGFTVWQIQKPQAPATATLAAPPPALFLNNSNPPQTWSGSGSVNLNGGSLTLGPAIGDKTSPAPSQ